MEFKIGDELICIHNPHKVWNITSGKIYDLRMYFDSAYIVDDKGEKFIFEDGLEDIWFVTCFISINEFRDKKLKELGI